MKKKPKEPRKQGGAGRKFTSKKARLALLIRWGICLECKKKPPAGTPKDQRKDWQGEPRYHFDRCSQSPAGQTRAANAAQAAREAAWAAQREAAQEAAEAREAQQAAEDKAKEDAEEAARAQAEAEPEPEPAPPVVERPAPRPAPTPGWVDVSTYGDTCPECGKNIPSGGLREHLLLKHPAPPTFASHDRPMKCATCGRIDSNPIAIRAREHYLRYPACLTTANKYDAGLARMTERQRAGLPTSYRRWKEITEQ